MAKRSNYISGGACALLILTATAAQARLITLEPIKPDDAAISTDLGANDQSASKEVSTKQILPIASKTKMTLHSIDDNHRKNSQNRLHTPIKQIWTLDPKYSLRKNISLWASKETLLSGEKVNVIWNLPGPGVFRIPIEVEGTWLEALAELSKGIRNSKPSWPIQMEYNTKIHTLFLNEITN